MEIKSYDSGLLSAECQRVLESMQFKVLTPVQARCLPLLMEGRDVLAQAKTGSGKTAAYGIPILEKLDVKRRDIQALVLCPTRELATQVAEHLRKIGRYRNNLQIVTLVGGRPAALERRTLEHGAHIIVGTPGRILDHLGRKALDFSEIKTVVLDEADRMLAMGFHEKIQEILEHTPSERQTSLFSATFPDPILSLSRKYQRNAERVVVETPALLMPEIEQKFYKSSKETKEQILVDVIAAYRPQSMLVFSNLKVSIEKIVQALQKSGHSADGLHGDLDQPTRERVMAKFRNQSTRILVATDVAARGLDIAGLDAVVNFDLPADPDQYVHRIGRTGRAGKKGLAISLVTSVEGPKLSRIHEVTGSSFPLLNPKDLKPAAPSAKEDKVNAAPMRTLSILGGRKTKLRPGDILGALTGEAGVRGEEVGKIEILDRVSYVAIARSAAGKAFGYFQHGKIKGRRFQVEWVN